MFFPKLRAQAKWMFVFLALVFGVGFVVFGVGSGVGGTGIGDLLQGGGGGSSGPSVSDAQKKIEKGDLAAYKELSDAYRADNKPEDAIAAGEQYVRARPKDYEFIRTLATDYEGQANSQAAQARAIQEELTSLTGGTTFSIPESSPLGRALGQGRIDQELTNAANQKLADLYQGMQSDFSRSADLYKQAAVGNPKDVLLQLLLANAAYQSRDNEAAIKAYQRVVKLAPGSVEARQAKQQILIIRAQTAAQNQPSR
jgi:hypothetical protein